MIRTLIVDDDALVRATLPSLLDWESCGYRIVQDCRSGQQALDFLRVHDIDLLITDIKMPGMGGLKLLERLRESGRMPVSVVLSGYDEFELVREAFRLGAYDYLLKSNLSEASLRRLLDDLRHKVFRDAAAQEAGPDRAEPALEAGRYIPAVFSIRNFPQAAQRYGGDLREKMQRPMLELARQIPRLSAILPEQPDLLGTLQRLDSAGERELWLHGVLRRVQAACAAGGAGQAQPDVMERAKAFIQDNFVNPELTLKTVADYVGFNEKYFSTRFAKECGCTFIAYLNGLRIQRAGQLLLQTDMKIYEVCEAVGYNNVEHFNHVFKKKMGTTPKSYRQSGENT